MGTLGVGACDHLELQNNTTADAIKIQETLAKAVDSGAQFSSIEISSHGIHQYRAKAVELNTAIFTNLTRDHLDYHGVMKSYGEAKRQLFLRKNLKNAVINVDDKLGRKLAKDTDITADKWLVSTKLPTAGANLERWVWAEDVVFSLEGIRAKIFTPWGSGKLDSPLIGAFNLSNLLLVVAALGGILKDLPLILSALKKAKAPPGRMDTLGFKVKDIIDKPLVIIDYAHTPDALEKALTAIREHCTGIITCVFGCGGDRDTGKRSLMAKISEKLANKVIVTSDNPRMSQ
jgi:UDP-N-acetylmuramoyl-L-alanyl-D-glutamate--2,6-diaminopimelate ligase